MQISRFNAKKSNKNTLNSHPNSSKTQSLVRNKINIIKHLWGRGLSSWTYMYVHHIIHPSTMETILLIFFIFIKALKSSVFEKSHRRHLCNSFLRMYNESRWFTFSITLDRFPSKRKKLPWRWKRRMTCIRNIKDWNKNILASRQ